MDLLGWAFQLAFVLSVALNLFQSMVLERIKRRLDQCEAELAEMEAAFGPKTPDWQSWP